MSYLSFTAGPVLFQPLSQATRDRCREIIAAFALQTISVAETRELIGELGEDLAKLVLSSASHQAKANEKLGDGVWWVTSKSLQQATPWQVAKLKASWFGEGLVYDLCCGIGGDAIHLSSDNDVVAVDTDDTVCTMVNENLLQHTDLKPKVVQGDATEQLISADNWVHIDPDRRVGDKRSVNPDLYSPAWSEVTKILANLRGGIVKLAPAATNAAIDRDDVHRVCISLAGTVREQSLLVGETCKLFHTKAATTHALTNASAVMVDREGYPTYYCPSVSMAELSPIAFATKPVGAMVDPDAAIRSAGLTESFADEFGLKTLGGPSGFLTGEVDLDGMQGLAICERVIWQGSCDDRRLRKELRSRDCYPWRVKTRGVSHDPNQLEKKLRDCGSQPCTLWIGRNGKRHYAALTTTAMD
ncbi:MAG: class I SAM-dependent methyltransferase [Pirellulaceae bacterium]